MGNLLGCVVGLENAITGITIIALGTSLPDTFASRTAALQEPHADASIGNVTGKQVDNHQTESLIYDKISEKLFSQMITA